MTPVSDGGGGNLEWGPAASGSLVRFTLDPDRVAPARKRHRWWPPALAAADRLWDTGIGPLIPARLSS